jgi:hypothetical protein
MPAGSQDVCGGGEGAVRSEGDALRSLKPVPETDG